MCFPKLSIDVSDYNLSQCWFHRDQLNVNRKWKISEWACDISTWVCLCVLHTLWNELHLKVFLFSPSAIIKTALPNMDREAKEEYLVVIQAKDMGGHSGGLSGTTTLTVTLTDVNDNPPKFAQSKLISCTRWEYKYGISTWIYIIIFSDILKTDSTHWVLNLHSMKKYPSTRNNCPACQIYLHFIKFKNIGDISKYQVCSI